MGNQIVVRIWNPADNLFEKEPSIILTNVVILDIVVEFSPLCKFHNNKNVVACVENLVELYDVVVIYEFQDSYLSFDLLCDNFYLGNHMFTLHLALVYDFDCNADSS